MPYDELKDCYEKAPKPTINIEHTLARNPVFYTLCYFIHSMFYYVIYCVTVLMLYLGN